MNNIIITGRLTRDPELRSTGDGIEVCSFNVAVDRPARKGQEKKADFFDCTAWRQCGVFINKYFRKGAGIVISGRMESDHYTDKNGNNRTGWKLVCENVEFPQSRSNTTNSTDTHHPEMEELTEEQTGKLPF